jgi:hypothetical protein
VGIVYGIGVEQEVAMKRMCMWLLAAVMILGCAGAGKMNQVQLGMTKDQVVEVLGKPVSSSAEEDTTFLKYKFFSKGIFLDAYYVKLKNGKVEAFGNVGDFSQGY